MTKPTLVISTGNTHKIGELHELLNGIPFEMRSLKDYPHVVPAEETGDTFKANAILKAVSVAEQTGELSFADDSGLVVDALDGRPGIFSSRYAADDTARIQRILTELTNVPTEKRTARFVCSIAVANANGQLWTVEGACEGLIDYSPRGDNGFGYDPIFLFPQLGKTFAELSAQEKNQYSHRSHAVRAILPILLEIATI
jgi:XTP/dITP diphosphohydrolase